MSLVNRKKVSENCSDYSGGSKEGMGIKGDWWVIDMHSADHQKGFLHISEHSGALGRF